MSNSLYMVSVRRPLPRGSFDAALRQVVRDRYGDLVRVERTGTAGWVVRSTPPGVEFTLWEVTDRTVSTRSAPGFFNRWVQEAVLNDTAYILGMVLRDEGSREKRVPRDSSAYTTYTAWRREVYENSGELSPALRATIPLEFARYL